jgi:subtilisin family serine protease
MSTLPNYTGPIPREEEGPIQLYPPLQKKDFQPGSNFSFVRFFVDEFTPTPFFDGIDGSGTKVAVLDTGIDATHPALRGAVDVESCRNFTADNGGRKGDVTDGNGHGTHCAGLIAAQPVGTIMSGVAPGCQIVALKVLSNEGERDLQAIPLRIASAIDYAVEIGVDVISMSLGLTESLFTEFQEEMSVMYASCQRALARGVVVVAAAGNDGRVSNKNTIEPPGGYDGVLTIASHNDSGVRSTFSSRGGELDFMAPGEVFSTWPIGLPFLDSRPSKPYEALEGTSMATPLVAGLAALLKQAGRVPEAAARGAMSPALWGLLRRTGYRGRNCYEVRETLRFLAERPESHSQDDGYGRLVGAYRYVRGEVPDFV